MSCEINPSFLTVLNLSENHIFPGATGNDSTPITSFTRQTGLDLNTSQPYNNICILYSFAILIC